MKLAHDDFLIAPDEELRKCYKSAKRMQRLLALPLLVSGGLFAVSVIDLITDILRMGHFSSSVADGVFAFAMGAAFVSMTSVFSEEPRRQTVLALVPLTVQVLLYPALLILDSKEGTHDKVLGDLQHAGIPVGAGQMTLQLVMILLSIIVFLLGRPVIRDIRELKKHPRFPFNNVLKDESIIHRTDAKGVLKIIDSSLNGSRVTQVEGEEYLEGEAKTYEKPAPDPSENFQQHKKIYRPREKSETAYTMDNLKNMYFDDGLENGELTGAELEKLLGSETRPKKPKEPEPEDFFQQAPIIYRPNKDGSVTIDHRTPGDEP